MTQIGNPPAPAEPTFNSEITQWPVFGEAEEKALLEAFRSGKWWYGDRVKEFEQKYAAYHDAEYGITCTNGTVALEIALRALGVGPGDEVIVPDYTFIATAGAVVTLNAIPRFADVDPVSANIDFDSAAALVTEHTKALIVVHFAGLPVDMEKARAFADQHNLKLVEDAAHAWGSQWRGKGVGALADVGTFSFQVTKNITGGEGGIILTNDPEIAKVCRSYTNCGRLEGHEWYEHFLHGGNNRMTEFQAAILVAQLDRLTDHIEIREQNAAFLDREFSNIPGLQVPERTPEVTRRSYHLYVLNYNSVEFGGPAKAEFIKALNAEGVPASTGYLCPVHANYCFQSLNDNPRPEQSWLSGIARERGIRFDKIENPNAQTLCDQTMIWLPHMLLLSSREAMEQVVSAVQKVHRQA